MSFLTPFKTSSTRESIGYNSPDEFFFQICFDEQDAFLQIIDKKGKAIQPDYRSYDGPLRNVLQMLEHVQQQNAFVIQWKASNAQRIYLADKPFIISLLSRTGRVVDEERKPILFPEVMGRLVVQLSKKSKNKTTQYNSTVGVAVADELHANFRLICEDSVLIDQSIYPIAPLGSAFKKVSFFDKVTLGEADISLFLSLLFTNLERPELRFEPYDVRFVTDMTQSKPCLIFENVDEDKNLYMRIAHALGDINPDLLAEIELNCYAFLNEANESIDVRPLGHTNFNELAALLEKRILKHASKKDKNLLHLESNVFIIPETMAEPFIYKELPDLLNEFKVLGVEKLKSYKIRTTPPKLSLKLDHNIDFFEGEVTLDFEEESFNLFDALRSYQKNRYIALSNGDHAIVDDAYMRKLQRLFKQKGKEAQISFFDLPLVEELIQDKISEDVFKVTRTFYEGFNTISSKRTRVPDVQAVLRPYQKYGYKWLRYLQENAKGGCLADDMGLGKTIQTLSLLAAAYPKESKPTLIVMPRSLLSNWAREAQKFTPTLQTYTFYGKDRDEEALQKAHVVFTTYSIARNEIKKLKEIEFFYVILDESQNIKNIQAQTTKAVMLLQAAHRLALSGTPLENNLGELYSLFRFLNPAMFGSLAQFSKDYLDPIQKYQDTDAMLALRKKIYPFILRRLKKDVLDDLPDKTEQTLFVEMTEDQARLYEKRRRFYQEVINQQIAKVGMQQSRFFVFQALNELRQIASVPYNIDEKIAGAKSTFLIEQLLDTIANGHKALVFVNFLTAIDTLGAALEEAGIDYVSMSGSTRDRQSLVDRFQKDPTCKVFIMTLKTGGTGLNLTAADTIFIYDPWWNVAAENQAIDRAHRIGQKNKVLAYKLITEGTIEEKIMKLQEVKQALFDNVISSDVSALKTLSEEDINYILGS